MDRQPQIPQTAPRSLLVEARKDKEWSQREVADLIGTTYVNISRWERGLTKPSSYFRSRLCKLFGKTEEELDLRPPRQETAPVPTTLLAATASAAPTVITSDILTLPIYDLSIPQPSTTHLIGRDMLLARLKEHLCSGDAHNLALTALNGLPGVGKTTLSLALAHDAAIRVHFRDGILWAGLGREPNLLNLLSHWGTLLGIVTNEAPTTIEALAQALKQAIGTRSMLIVLDDAWEIDHALALKVGGPNCAHLVTTRFPSIALQIAPEGSTMLQELNEEDGLDLLHRLAPNVIVHEQGRASQLVKAVGGLPLALTLMGKYLRLQSDANQPRRIRTALEQLNDVERRLQLTEKVSPNDRHTSLPTDSKLSVQSVISVTDQLLDEPTRNALYALSVFPAKPNNFSEEAALAVMDASFDVLDTLSDMGLLESSAPGRYTLHQTIADYARIQLKARDEHGAYDRYITYILDYIVSHRKDYEQLEQETNSIMAALDAAHTLHKTQQLIQGVCAFAPYLLMRGFYDNANTHLQRALAAAQAQHDQHGIASILLYLGEIAQKQGNYSQAEAHFKEGLSLARAINHPERISTLLNDLGWVTWKQGNYAQAETYLKEGLELAKQIVDIELICSILKTLGSLAFGRGDYKQAGIYLEEGLTFAYQIGDKEQICPLLISLGVTEGEQGHYAQAEKYFLEGLGIAREIGHREWISALLSNLGEAASEQGKYREAEQYFREGLTFAQQIGHREWTGMLLSNMGLTIRKQGYYAQAEKYLRESLTLARQIGTPQMTANALYEYGNLYLDQKKTEDAEKTFHEMLNVIPEGGQDLLALARYGLARTFAKKGDVHEARWLGEASVITLEEMGHRRAQEVRKWLDTVIN
ncbi:MAG: hypothetical protein NVS4B11_15640 [Ktedonobacteraceae bacterium]